MSRLSPVNMLKLAQGFLAAGQRELAHARPRTISLPAYFLISRAIELGLKTFLLLGGAGAADLKKVGHDLVKAAAAAFAAGLSDVVALPPEGELALRMINPYYAAKDLEYVTTGSKQYPPAQHLAVYAEKLLAALTKPVRAWRPVN